MPTVASLLHFFLIWQAALLHLFPEQPLYRLLPPSFRSLWLKWVSENKARGDTAQQEEAAAALLARDRFVQSMVSRPLGPNEPIRLKKKKLEDEEGKEVPMDEAAAARARQAQREAEEEEADRLELKEEQERLKRERQTTENARVKVAFERFQQSDVGIANANFRASLPIQTLWEPLTHSLNTRQVALVCGETGSGKSTQVPQMILEHEMGSNRGGGTFILCTQPRRIAAISLARRVASERGEQLGQQVGYQVRAVTCCHVWHMLLRAPHAAT